MSEQPIGPALRKRQLAIELAALRETAGLSTATVAQHLRCNRSQISHYEAGRRLPDYPTLRMMLDLYDATDRLDELSELLEAADQRGWWDISGIPGWLRAYIGLEADASHIHAFALEWVPGLLQTHDYARRVRSSFYPDDKALELEVTTSLRRQDRVGSSLVMDVVMSQALLERLAAMGEVGIGQLHHFTELAGRRGMDLRVLPFTAGHHDCGSGSFLVMDFPAGIAPTVGYVMYALGGHLVDDTAVVEGLRHLYQDLRTRALDTGDSMNLIAAYADRRKP